MARLPEDLKNTLIRRQVFLERHKVGEIEAFQPFLEQMRLGVINTLATDITDLNRARLQKKLDGLNDTLSDVYKDYRKVWLKQARDLATEEVGFNARAINTVIDEGVALPTPLQLETALLERPLHIEGPHTGKLLDQFFVDITANEVKKVENVINLGFAQGETTPQIVSRVLGTARSRFRDGTFKEVQRSAEALTRTALTHASNAAKQSLYEKNSRFIKKVEWISTLDVRTTTICKSLDGQQYPLNKGPRPPIHIGCRSVMGPAFDERFKFLDEDATRASRNDDGVERVKAEHTYYSWLKTQDKDFQDKAIGPRWGKLFREGGLSAGRFAELRLDRQFQPITLIELKELEPVAFSKAGL